MTIGYQRLFLIRNWVILAAMKRLAALMLIAFLPAIVLAKGGHGTGSHGGSHASGSSHGGHSHGTQGSSSSHHGARFGIHRNSAARRSFQTSNPCQATGKTNGSCKGYVIDHKTPLAYGGADSPENMQWQTTAAAKIKDRTERAGCR